MARRQSQPLLAVASQVAPRAGGQQTVAGAIRRLPRPHLLEGSVKTSPESVGVVEVADLRQPAGQTVGVLAAVAAVKGVAAVDLQEGLLDDNGPQLAVIAAGDGDGILAPVDENAVVDDHFARNAVEGQLHDVLAGGVEHGASALLWEQNAGNQRLLEAFLVVGAADHRGDDRAVSHLVLADSKGVQRPLDEHRIDVQLRGGDETHRGVEETLGNVVVERIGEGYVTEVMLVRVEPGKKHVSVDGGGLGEDSSLSRTQWTVDIGLVTSTVLQRLGRRRCAGRIVGFLNYTCR